LLPSEKYWLDKHGLSLGSWDAWPKKYRWKAMIKAPEKNYVNSINIDVFNVGGGEENKSNWPQDKPESADSIYYLKWPESTWEMISNDTIGIRERELPCLIHIGWFSPKEPDALDVYFIPDKKQLIKAFETGLYDRLVFEVNKNLTATVWLLGPGENKIKLTTLNTLTENWDSKMDSKKQNKL